MLNVDHWRAGRPGTGEEAGDPADRAVERLLDLTGASAAHTPQDRVLHIDDHQGRPACPHE
jgi:hypothetical protein